MPDLLITEPSLYCCLSPNEALIGSNSLIVLFHWVHTSELINSPERKTLSSAATLEVKI